MGILKRLWVPLLAAAIAAIVATGVARAVTPNGTVNWPATCQHFGCTNNHLNRLDIRLRAGNQARANADVVETSRIAELRQAVRKLRIWKRGLLVCLTEQPVTRYGATDANQTFFESYDNTKHGDVVDFWMVHDNCTPAVFSRPPAP